MPYFSWNGRNIWLLEKSGIEVMVISGAPKIILDFYKKEFHIREIFAFKERKDKFLACE